MRERKWNQRQGSTWTSLNTTSTRWPSSTRKVSRALKTGGAQEVTSWWAPDKISEQIRIKCITQQVDFIPLGLEIGSQLEEMFNQGVDSNLSQVLKGPGEVTQEPRALSEECKPSNRIKLNKLPRVELTMAPCSRLMIIPWSVLVLQIDHLSEG